MIFFFTYDGRGPIFSGGSKLYDTAVQKEIAVKIKVHCYTYMYMYVHILVPMCVCMAQFVKQAN